MLYILLSACFLCFVLLLRYTTMKGECEPPRLPGGLPFIGHGLLFIGDSVKSYNNIKWISEECMKRGGVVSGYLGFRKAYCVTDSEAILEITNSCLEKEYMYSFAKGFVGDGLITGSGVIWKRHRKLLNPAFSQQVLNSFIECFNSQARRLVDLLALQLGKPFDHEGLLRKNNLESICLTATGTGGDEYTSLQQKYLLLIPKFQIILYERFKQFLYHSNFIYNFSKLKKHENKMLESVVDLSNQIIQKKKDEMQTNGIQPLLKTKGTVKPFLELILDISNERKCFTDDEIRHETDSIIAAGHETSANCLNITLIALGSYPAVQEKVYKEILHVIGNVDRDLNKDDLKKLVYTEAVLKEALRLFPVVPVVARNIDKDIKLRNYILKANSACFIFFYGLNRNPSWGPDATQFKPERWLNKTTLPGRNHFGSFSLGKRNCIGKEYAMMSMKTTLVHLVRNYKVMADLSKVVLKWHMLTYPASGHHYTLQRRAVLENQK